MTMFGPPPYTLETEPDEINRAMVLDSDHILMPASVAKTANEKAHKMNGECRDWMYGGTSLGNHMWMQYYYPTMKKARRFAGQKKWRTYPTRELTFV